MYLIFFINSKRSGFFPKAGFRFTNRIEMEALSLTMNSLMGALKFLLSIPDMGESLVTLRMSMFICSFN